MREALELAVAGSVPTRLCPRWAETTSRPLTSAAVSVVQFTTGPITGAIYVGYSGVAPGHGGQMCSGMAAAKGPLGQACPPPPSGATSPGPRASAQRRPRRTEGDC